MYDVTIVGAGPAGATLARLIGRRYKVLLLDKRELINADNIYQDKCCGGLIAPDAQKMLAQFGLGVPKEVLVGPQLFTVRTIDIQNNIERYYQRHYINMDRGKFDRWLVSLIPSTVDIRCNAVFKRYIEQMEFIKIVFKYNGKEYCEKTKYLIGADGGFSTLRRQVAPNFEQKKYISVQEWFRMDSTQPYFSAIFDNEISDFYSWTIPKDDFLIAGTAIAPKDNVNGKFELLKRRLIERGFKLENRCRKHGAFIVRPISNRQVFLGKGNIAFIGEAAGWISPTSAEGLSYAFRSALALARSLNWGSKHLINEYSKNTRSLKLNIMLKNMKSPFMYNYLLRKTVMKTGILSMNMMS